MDLDNEQNEEVNESDDSEMEITEEHPISSEFKAEKHMFQK